MEIEIIFLVAVGQWIMVDFDKPVYVLGAITQSRLATTHGDDWITKYIVAYGNDTNSLVTIKDDKGNAEVNYSKQNNLLYTLVMSLMTIQKAELLQSFSVSRLSRFKVS